MIGRLAAFDVGIGVMDYDVSDPDSLLGEPRTASPGARRGNGLGSIFIDQKMNCPENIPECAA
jgi:hypothetical protein